MGSGRWRTRKEATGQHTCQCEWGLAGGGLRRRLPVSALVSVGGVWLVEDWEGLRRLPVSTLVSVGGVWLVEDQSVHLSVCVGSGWWRTEKEATGQCTCQCSKIQSIGSYQLYLVDN